MECQTRSGEWVWLCRVLSISQFYSVVLCDCNSVVLCDCRCSSRNDRYSFLEGHATGLRIGCSTIQLVPYLNGMKIPFKKEVVYAVLFLVRGLEIRMHERIVIY